MLALGAPNADNFKGYFSHNLKHCNVQCGIARRINVIKYWMMRRSLHKSQYIS